MQISYFNFRIFLIVIKKCSSDLKSTMSAGGDGSGGGSGTQSGEGVASGSGSLRNIVTGVVAKDPLHPANERLAKKRQDQMASMSCFEAGNVIYLKRPPEDELSRLVI